MTVAGLLRRGTALGRLPGAFTRRSGFAAVLSHTELNGRVVASLLAMVATLPLIFLLAVRRDVGTDYVSYVLMYERFRAGETLPWIEPLYASLNQLAAPLGSSGMVLVFAVSAALAALPLFYRVFRSSPMPWLGVLVLFGLSFPFFMTNGVRSAIAVGIVMIALPALWRRQLVVWSLGILLAAGFHFTALLVWPLYWVLHLAWPRALAVVGLACAIILSTSRDIAVGFLQLVPEILPSKYAHYPDRVLERLDTYEFGLGYLVYLVLSGLVLLVWNRAQGEGREVLVFRNTAILGLALVIGLYQFWAVGRLGLYFLPALAVFLPWVVTRCVVPRERMLWTVGFAALFGVMFLRGLWVGAHDAVPYQWVF
jgi:hypothetical protein